MSACGRFCSLIPGLGVTSGTVGWRGAQAVRAAENARLDANKHFAAADLDGVVAGAASGERQVRCRSMRPQSPAKLVIHAGAHQVLGERYRAVRGVGVIYAADRTLRTANRAQVHIEVLDLGADRVGDEVFDDTE